MISQWVYVEELRIPSPNDIEPEGKWHVLESSPHGPYSCCRTVQYKVKSFTNTFLLATRVYIRRLVNRGEMI